MMKIFYFHCADEHLLEPTVAATTIAGLLASGEECVLLPDLCALAEEKSEKLRPLSGLEDAVIISAYQHRAVRALLAYAGIQIADSTRIICHRDRCACNVLGELFDQGPQPGDEHIERTRQFLESVQAAPETWRPWFPVIDYELCVSCKQCAAFCLFGVYEVDDDRVSVANPRNCKDNCPACSRICPAGAVVFPKFPDPPVNGGEGGEDKPIRLNVSELVDGDVMAKLRERAGGNAGAAGILKGLQERQDCACKEDKDCDAN
jgi:Pyruvate/2-oxoacid:ferredoxin oxidoreductase delta subunit